MGKIQSAITGALMTSIGAMGVKSKMTQAKNNQALSNEASAMFGKTYEGANEEERNNLINRQDEANEIANSYVKSAKFQKQALETRIQQVGGIKSKEGQMLVKAGQTASDKLKEATQTKMNQLKLKKGDK